MIARHADRPTAITLGVDKALRRRRLRQRAALDERDMSHRTPAAAALRLTGERSGTAAMPSARAFANISSRHSAGSRQVAGQESAAGASSRWRSRRLPRSCRRGASHLPGQVSGASPMANPLLGLSRASWTCATDRPAPSSHPAESPFSRKLLNAAGAAAAELSNRRNAALSRARAAKYPHPGILSLRHLPSHCDERLAHEHDIGRWARYRNDARSRRGPNGVARIGDA